MTPCVRGFRHVAGGQKAGPGGQSSKGRFGEHPPRSQGATHESLLYERRDAQLASSAIDWVVKTVRTDRLLTRWIPSRGNSRGAYSTRPDVEQEAAYEGVERVFQESGRIGGTRVTAD
jgi:hypothetical protein